MTYHFCEAVAFDSKGMFRYHFLTLFGHSSIAATTMQHPRNASCSFSSSHWIYLPQELPDRKEIQLSITN